MSDATILFRPASDDVGVRETVLEEKVRNLEEALTTARRIGAAVGVVMATKKLNYDEAFQALVAYSQQRHRKLRQVAEDVLWSGDL